MVERIVKFGQYKNLVGIITKPEIERGKLPVIIFLNSGMVPMLGPNRLHVSMARKMTEIGFTSLRFDFAGVGNSTIIKSRDFEESAINDAMLAMDMLESTEHTRFFVLIGICSGGDIAMKTALVDERIIGLISVNGVYFDKKVYQELLANNGSREYLTMIPVIVSNAVRYLINKITNIRENDALIAPVLDLLNKEIDLFLIYSEGSYRLSMVKKTILYKLIEFREKRLINLNVFHQIDSMFTPIWSQNKLIEITCKWLELRYKNDSK